MYVCRYVCLYVCMYVCMCVCIRACVDAFVCMSAFMHVCIFVYALHVSTFWLLNSERSVYVTANKHTTVTL